ncbi:MAG: hypothetical protein ACK55Z_06865, partial [bacterium]
GVNAAYEADVMVCIDATFDELTKLALNAYLVSNEDVNCDEPLITLSPPIVKYLASYDEVN